jgi:hypothetical protein
VLKPSGEVALDPDEGVRQVIELVFAVFERRRSVIPTLADQNPCAQARSPMDMMRQG